MATDTRLLPSVTVHSRTHSDHGTETDQIVITFKVPVGFLSSQSDDGALAAATFETEGAKVANLVLLYTGRGYHQVGRSQNMSVPDDPNMHIYCTVLERPSDGPVARK